MDNAIMDNSIRIINEFFPGKSFSARQRKIITWMVGEHKLLPVLEQACEKQGVSWIESIVESLQIRCETRSSDFDNIPSKGPAIVVSNHPTVVDALWRGIFSFVRRYPTAEYLLGVLSIPGGFSPESKKLIISFYDAYFSDSKYAFSVNKMFTIENDGLTPFFRGGIVSRIGYC